MRRGRSRRELVSCGWAGRRAGRVVASLGIFDKLCHKERKILYVVGQQLYDNYSHTLAQNFMWRYPVLTSAALLSLELFILLPYIVFICRKTLQFGRITFFTARFLLWQNFVIIPRKYPPHSLEASASAKPEPHSANKNMLWSSARRMGGAKSVLSVLCVAVDVIIFSANKLRAFVIVFAQSFAQ